MRNRLVLFILATIALATLAQAVQAARTVLPSPYRPPVKTPSLPV